MPKVRRTCTKCGSLFWTSPYKDEEGNWHTATKCQRCKNRERQEKQRKRKGKVRIRDLGKVDLNREIQRLIWLENKHPKLIEKIRNKEYGKKKEKSTKFKRSKEKIKR